MQLLYYALAFVSFSSSTLGFLAPSRPLVPFANTLQPRQRRQQPLHMGLFDYVNPLYWKREYITAAMLSRQVPSSTRVVLELYPENGKRFFYYPPTVSQIVAVPKSYPLSDKSQLEFDESARRAIKDLVVRKDLQSTVSNSVDVVVSVGALQTASSRSCLKDLHRILRPGGRMVFVEPLKDFELLENTAFDEVLFDEEDGFAVGYATKALSEGSDAAPRTPLTQPEDAGLNREARRKASGAKGKSKRKL